MLVDDGDPVRALGFISMYSAWAEEDVDDILRQLEPIHPFTETEQRKPISWKLKHTAKIIESFDDEELDGLAKALRCGVTLFEKRNKAIHGRIYVGNDDHIYARSGRPNAPTERIASNELYALANNFTELRKHFIGPQIFRLPRAIQGIIARSQANQVESGQSGSES